MRYAAAPCSNTSKTATMPVPLALTLGEPAGIGPDITLAAWRRRVECALAPFYLLADPELIIRRSKQLAEDVPICVVEPAAAAAAFKHSLPVVDIGINVSAQPGRPDGSSAPAALEAIRRAVADVTAGSARAIVTNPIAKNVLYRSGFTEPGHTEYLARLAMETSGVAVRPVMMLWSPELAVVPVTIHLPLREVIPTLTPELVAETGRIVARDSGSGSALRIRASPSLASTLMLASRALSATRIATLSAWPWSASQPRESTPADRCRPTRSSMRRPAQITTLRSPCITIRH